MIELRRIELELSISDVAYLTGLSYGTIVRIESEDKDGWKVNLSTARAIADGLDSQLHTLFHPLELSHLGRPALTGTPIDDLAERRSKKAPPCTTCFMVPSADEIQNNRCKECNIPLSAAS